MEKESPFKKYHMWTDDNLINDDDDMFYRANEAFELFKSLYHTGYGSIEEDENLISIHTGGWSENEHLISQFKKTWWWYKYLQITANGGHYYFDTDSLGEKKWVIETKIT